MTAGPSSTLELPGSGKTASIIAIEAAFDLSVAMLIIAAGSQGIYRFAPQNLVWAALYATIALKFAVSLRSLIPVLRANIAIMAYPAVAILSAFWSVGAVHTAYSATQLTVTYLMGFWLGWRYRPRSLVWVILLSLSPLIALSLVNFATGAFGMVYSYEGGLLGIFPNKNTLGRMSLLLVLAALALTFGGRLRPWQRLALLGVIAMAALALLLSKSATSMLVLFATSGLLVALTVHSWRASLRLAIGGAGVLAFLIGCGLLAFSDIPLTGAVLDTFGKSSNLTGRTSLWAVAHHQIDATPWLGVGFDAYWDSGIFRAVDRIQLSFGEGLTSFHNFVLDIWVGQGVPGLIAMALTLGTVAFQCLRYYVARRDADGALMLAFLVAAIGVGLFNPLLYFQHDNMIMMLIAFAVSARVSLRARDQATRSE